MKNFTLAVSGLFLCAVYCPAEMLDSVTFNPARLGQYERLKVSDDLTSPGGVEARSVAVQSGGTVSVENAGNYDITQAEVKGSVNMTSTGFEAPKVDSRGGTASFEQTGNRVESRINTLTGAVLKAKANVLRTAEVSVTGVPSAGYEGAQIQGLKLGGNDIPKRDGCSGLNWYARTAGDGNTYKVLGMGNCTGGAGELTCPPSASDPRTFKNAELNKCGCPGSYEYYHNGACCSYLTDKSDTRCWSDQPSVTWTWQDKGTKEYASLGLCEAVTLPAKCASGVSAGALCQGSGAVYPGGSGENCLTVCRTESKWTGSQYIAVYKRTLFVCLNDTTYSKTARWDPSKDSRYACGH